MGCVEELPYEVFLSRASFAECCEYVEEHGPGDCHVGPGFRLFEQYMIGVPPIAIGTDGDAILFPYTKPCHGAFLLRIEDANEVARLAQATARSWKSSPEVPQGPVRPRTFP